MLPNNGKAVMCKTYNDFTFHAMRHFIELYGATVSNYGMVSRQSSLKLFQNSNLAKSDGC
jgi:hypothetical protein